jgi:hypothetical protein
VPKQDTTLYQGDGVPFEAFLERGACQHGVDRDRELGIAVSRKDKTGKMLVPTSSVIAAHLRASTGQPTPGKAQTLKRQQDFRLFRPVKNQLRYNPVYFEPSIKRAHKGTKRHVATKTSKY